MINILRLYGLVCFLLASSPSYAEELKYTEIQEGDPAPFTGLLYTNAAIAKILSDHELELEKLNIDFEYQIKLNNSDWQFRYDILEKKHELETQMYIDMIERRDILIDNKKRFQIPDNIKFIGGVVVGAAITITVAYSLDTLVYE